MKVLTKNERTLLADNFLKLAQITGQFRIENYQSLSPIMKSRIRQYHKQLIDYADHFYAASTSFIIENAEDSIKNITDLTKELKTIVKHIKKVQKFINIIGSATQLGASIVSKQPFAITASLNGFITSIEKLKN